jgi:hypothetical protein
MVLAFATCLGLTLITGSYTLYHASAFLFEWDLSDRMEQLRRERKLELVLLFGKVALWLSWGSFWLLLLLYASELTSWVEGAMCGEGVMEAAGSQARQGLGLFFASIPLSGWWWGMAQRQEARLLVAEEDPRPLARLWLIWLPLVGFAGVLTLNGLSHLITAQVVDCCAAAYDGLLGARSLSDATGRGNADTFLFFFLPTMALYGVGLWRRAKKLTLGALSGGWLILMVFGKSVVLPPVYGVLHHHCLWCTLTEVGSFWGWAMLGTGAPLTLALTALQTTSPSWEGRWWTWVRWGSLIHFAVLFAPLLWVRWQSGFWLMD